MSIFPAIFVLPLYQARIAASTPIAVRGSLRIVEQLLARNSLQLAMSDDDDFNPAEELKKESTPIRVPRGGYLTQLVESNLYRSAMGSSADGVASAEDEDPYLATTHNLPIK